MPRGSGPPLPGRGRGRGLGQVVRPPTLDGSDAPEASTQPICATSGPSFNTYYITEPVGRLNAVYHILSSTATYSTFTCSTRNKQSIWIANDVWASLLEYWRTDEFKKKSTQNKANRLANPAIANTIYRGGSSSMGEHKRKLEAQLGRPPQRMEVFASCYKKKDDGSWSGSRAEEVAETYQKMLEERVSELTPPEEGGSSAANVTPLEEEQLWTEAAGGRKRGRVFGMGSEALTSNAARPWTKDHRASTSSTATPQNILSQHSFRKSNLCWAYSSTSWGSRCAPTSHRY
ncbi:UNVERIFIED_CONTAM: hypothetical protein Sradi_3657700 [Sesamum radiatum]|uniref:Uncharacterized protein n=1 Tax=Sesamum radiatum TaxID=300843 RepID=A0AAW2QJ82_SESRA